MYWSLGSEGLLYCLGTEDAAVFWAESYPNDIVFFAELTPMSDSEE